MAIRANQLTNFKGEAYATQNFVQAEDAKLLEAINQIKGTLTDGIIDSETGNLSAKYNPIKVLSTENKTGLPAVEIKEGDTVVNPEYYPDNDYSKIQFIGDCKVTYRNDGQIVIRIGENLNSSNFNIVDGQTTGVAGSITAPSGSAGIAPDGTSVTALTTGNYTIATATAAAKIHFENNENTYFLMNVSDNGVAKTYYFGPITGSGTYNAKLTDADGDTVSGVSLTVSNFGEETKSAEGATGYCGSIKFTIAASAIAGGDASKISVTSVTHKNGGEGDFGYTCAANNRYFYTDTATKASVTGIPTYAISGTATATKSGITYFTKGSVTFNASGLADMLNPVGISNGVAFDANNWATDVSVSATAGSTTASKASSLVSCAVAAPTVKVTPANINGTASTNGSQTSANDFGSGIVVYTGSINANIDEGDGTVGRITSAGAKWTSADKLGATDLQLYQGKITYPSVNFTGYNGVNADRDYSALGTGEKVYYVKLPFARVTSQPTLTITGSGLTNANLKAVCIAPTLDVIDNRNALLMTSAGGICDNSDNKNATSRVLALSFMGFGEQLTTAGAYAKIVMSGTGAEISNITLA